MPDLAARLRAHVDEDERVALACIAEVGRGHVGDPFEDGSGVREQDDYPSYPWGSQEAELAFMRRFDPARTLRVVEAIREILEMHADADGSFSPTVRALASVYEPVPSDAD